MNTHGMTNKQIDQTINELLAQRELNICELQNHELAGFGLAGYRQTDGSIKMSNSGRYINDWPEKITLLNDTFTLEEIIKGDDGFENAEYC